MKTDQSVKSQDLTAEAVSDVRMKIVERFTSSTVKRTSSVVNVIEFRGSIVISFSWMETDEKFIFSSGELLLTMCYG